MPGVRCTRQGCTPLLPCQVYLVLRSGGRAGVDDRESFGRFRLHSRQMKSCKARSGPDRTHNFIVFALCQALSSRFVYSCRSTLFVSFCCLWWILSAHSRA